MSSSSLSPDQFEPRLPAKKAPRKKKLTLVRSVFSRGLSRNMVAAVIQHFVGVLCQLLIYRMLISSEGIEVLGLWSLTVGVISLARLADFSGGSSLSRFVAVAREDASSPSPENYIDSVLLFTLGLYTAIAVIAWYPLLLLVQGVSTAVGGGSLSILVGVALLSLVLSALSGGLLSALAGLQRSDIRSSIIILGWIVYLGASMYAVPRFGLIGLAIAQIGQEVLILLLARIALVRCIAELRFLPLNFNWVALRETMAYGLKVQLNTLLQVAFDPLCRLMIAWTGGMSALGVYEIALRIGGNARTLVGVASGPLVPAFAQASVDGSRRAESFRLLGRVQEINVPAAISLLILVVLLSPAFSIFMLGQLDTVFIYLVAAFALASVAHVLAFPLQAMSQGEGRLLGNILGTFGMAIGGQAFIPVASKFVGPDYAGLGVAGAIVLGATISIISNVYILKTPMKVAIPWLRLLPFLAALISACTLTMTMSG